MEDNKSIDIFPKNLLKNKPALIEILGLENEIRKLTLADENGLDDFGIQFGKIDDNLIEVIGEKNGLGGKIVEMNGADSKDFHVKKVDRKGVKDDFLVDRDSKTNNSLTSVNSNAIKGFSSLKRVGNPHFNRAPTVNKATNGTVCNTVKNGSTQFLKTTGNALPKTTCGLSNTLPRKSGWNSRVINGSNSILSLNKNGSPSNSLTNKSNGSNHVSGINKSVDNFSDLHRNKTSNFSNKIETNPFPTKKEPLPQPNKQETISFSQMNKSKNSPKPTTSCHTKLATKSLPNNGTKIDPNDPQVKKLVYNMYRGLLSSKHGQSTDIIESAPIEKVVKDEGVMDRVTSMIKQEEELRRGKKMIDLGPAPPPPPPPFSIPSPYVPTQEPKRTGNKTTCESNTNSSSLQNGPAPPAVLAGAMMKDKKPFTYTPGGIDLNEINNPVNEKVPQSSYYSTGTQIKPSYTQNKVSVTIPIAGHKMGSPVTPSKTSWLHSRTNASQNQLHNETDCKSDSDVNQNGWQKKAVGAVWKPLSLQQLKERNSRENSEDKEFQQKNFNGNSEMKDLQQQNFHKTSKMEEFQQPKWSENPKIDKFQQQNSNANEFQPKKSNEDAEVENLEQKKLSCDIKVEKAVPLPPPPPPPPSSSQTNIFQNNPNIMSKQNQTSVLQSEIPVPPPLPKFSNGSFKNPENTNLGYIHKNDSEASMLNGNDKHSKNFKIELNNTSSDRKIEKSPNNSDHSVDVAKKYDFIKSPTQLLNILKEFSEKRNKNSSSDFSNHDNNTDRNWSTITENVGGTKECNKTEETTEPHDIRNFSSFNSTSSTCNNSYSNSFANYQSTLAIQNNSNSGDSEIPVPPPLPQSNNSYKNKKDDVYIKTQPKNQRTSIVNGISSKMNGISSSKVNEVPSRIFKQLQNDFSDKNHEKMKNLREDPEQKDEKYLIQRFQPHSVGPVNVSSVSSPRSSPDSSALDSLENWSNSSTPEIISNSGFNTPNGTIITNNGLLNGVRESDNNNKNIGLRNPEIFTAKQSVLAELTSQFDPQATLKKPRAAPGKVFRYLQQKYDGVDDKDSSPKIVLKVTNNS